MYNLDSVHGLILGNNTKKASAFWVAKRAVKKAYVHWASKGSNPLGIVFYSMTKIQLLVSYDIQVTVLVINL
jgi:hypothetical protein